MRKMMITGFALIHASLAMSMNTISNNYSYQGKVVTPKPALIDINERFTISKEMAKNMAEKVKNIKPAVVTYGHIETKSKKITLCQGEYYKKLNIKHLSRPIFLIGNSDMSISWLKDHEKTLINMNSQGYMIQMKSKRDLLFVKNKFPRLHIMPGNGDAFYSQLGIKCYPVLITRKEINNLEKS